MQMQIKLQRPRCASDLPLPNFRVLLIKSFLTPLIITPSAVPCAPHVCPFSYLVFLAEAQSHLPALCLPHSRILQVVILVQVCSFLSSLTGSMPLLSCPSC